MLLQSPFQSGWQLDLSRVLFDDLTVTFNEAAHGTQAVAF